jgi:hypothetical protein
MWWLNKDILFSAERCGGSIKIYIVLSREMRWLNKDILFSAERCVGAVRDVMTRFRDVVAQ